MDFAEVYEEAVGLNEDGSPKAYISMTYQIYNEKTENLITKNEYSLLSPEIAINNTDIATEIQIKFDSKSEIELNAIWNVAQMCMDAILKDEQGDGDVYHVLNVNIIPVKFNGRYFIVASAPVFVSLQADSPDKKANVISAIFRNDDVIFYESDDIDMVAIESEVEREIAEQERLDAIAEQKRLEREAFEERRNQLLRQKRRF